MTNRESGVEWDEWSETTILLDHSHSVDRQISHLTEDSNKTSTRPLLGRPLSVDEFRQLMRKGVDETGSASIDKNAESKNEGFFSGLFYKKPFFIFGFLVVTGTCAVVWYRTR